MLGHVTVFLTMPVDPMLARLKVGLHVGSLIFVVYLQTHRGHQTSRNHSSASPSISLRPEFLALGNRRSSETPGPPSTARSECTATNNAALSICSRCQHVWAGAARLVSKRGSFAGTYVPG